CLGLVSYGVSVPTACPFEAGAMPGPGCLGGTFAVTCSQTWSKGSENPSQSLRTDFRSRPNRPVHVITRRRLVIEVSTARRGAEGREGVAARSGGDALVLVLEVLDRLVRVQVEDRLADGQPVPAVEEEHGRGVAQVPDRGEILHVAPLDGLELDGHADQGDDLARAALADELDVRAPLALFPAQAARLAGPARSGEELRLQALALQAEQLAGLLQTHLLAERPQRPPAQRHRQPD